MSLTTENSVLDALDDMAVGLLEMSDGVAYRGPIATIQHIAGATRVSDATALKAVHALRQKGLVKVWDGLDPSICRRRLYVTGVEA